MPQRDIVALHAIAFMLLLPSAKSLAICATVSNYIKETSSAIYFLHQCHD